MKKKIIGYLVSLLCLSIIILNLNLEDVFNHLLRFNFKFILYALISLSIGYFFRIVRWHKLLIAAGNKLILNQCFTPFMASVALNNPLPLRAGDVIRVIVFPSLMSITKTDSASSLIAERTFDLLILLFLILVGFSFDWSNIIEFHKLFVLIFFLILLIMFFLGSTSISRNIETFLEKIKRNKNSPKIMISLSEMLFQLTNNFKFFSKKNNFFPALISSVFIWVAESFVFYFIMLGFNFDANISSAFLVMAFSTLSTLIPSSPGYFGPFHLAAYTSLLMYGYDSDISGSYAFFIHLILWLPTTLVGIIAMLFNPRLFNY